MDNKESIGTIDQKTLPYISIDESFKHFHKIIRDKEYYLIGEYIHSLLFNKSKQSIDIIDWIKKHLNEYIDTIIQEILKYIGIPINTDNSYAEMFDICCQIDLEKTKQYWKSDIFIYNKILELHHVKKDFEKYKSKYQSVKNYMNSMANGLLYYEINDDYQKYINQIK